jgi:hypothetical protein
MRIVELLQEEELWDYKERLKDIEKMKSLGDGAYGEVFQHPRFSNVVVKVFDHKTDTSYKKFLRWAQQHQNNPYIPKIIEVHLLRTVRNEESAIGIVFMKKLKPCPRSVYNRLYNDAASALMSSREYRTDPDIRRSVDRLLQKHEDFQHWPRFAWSLLGRHTKDKYFKEFCDLMSTSAGGDLHDENIMVDTNGQIVFTDPLA